MLQQDLLDTLFLNRKALADIGDAGTGNSNGSAADTNDATGTTGTTKANKPTHTTHTTAAAAQKSTLPFIMNSVPGSTPGAGSAQCPMDHNKPREAWTEHAKAQSKITPPQPTTSTTTSENSARPSESRSSWWSRIPLLWTSSTPVRPPDSHSPSTAVSRSRDNLLDTNRLVSSIPRSISAGATSSACPVNDEIETGADTATGNWVYPSEKMFFDAMKRKGHHTRAQDMKTVVPIHNAVNERAWGEIREWERPYERPGCPNGPMLYSFTGLSAKMSPRARLNTLLGYTAPFDRHDWVVDRCGTRIEYVIDFYAGRSYAATAASSSSNSGPPSFYLDVRPKLNSWEGIRMRTRRALRLV